MNSGNTFFQRAVMHKFLKTFLLLQFLFAPMMAQVKSPENTTGKNDSFQLEPEVRRMREENRLLLDAMIMLQQEVRVLRLEMKLGLLEINLEREQRTEERFTKEKKEIDEDLANLKVDSEQAENSEEKTRIEADEQKALIERAGILNEIEKAGARVDELKNEIEKTKAILQSLKTATKQHPLSVSGERTIP